MIPEGQPKYNDLIDIVITASQKTVDVPQKDGTVTKEQILDDDTLYFKTLSVHAYLGRGVYELKEWERTAQQARQNMSEERAMIIGAEMIECGISYRRALDSKSSESKRDKQNSQSTLLDKINHKTSEKIYTQKGEMKRSMVDMFLGRDQEKDNDES